MSSAASRLLLQCPGKPLPLDNAADPGSTAPAEDSTEFVWVKKKLRDRKVERQGGSSHADPEEIKRELERLKIRRIERDEDLRLREEERMLAQREADRAQFGDWESREDQFQLRQTKNRAEIRFREGRARPIDRLALSLLLASSDEDRERLLRDGFMVDPLDPVRIFDRASSVELRAMVREIELYSYLDSEDEKNMVFWKNLLCVCEYTLAKSVVARPANPTDRHPTQPASSLAMIAPAVLRDIDKMLSDLSLPKLFELETSVREKLASNEEIDVEYWEAMLDAVMAWQARTGLTKFHMDLVAKSNLTLAEIAKSGTRVKKESVEPMPPPSAPPVSASLAAVTAGAGRPKAESWEELCREAEESEFSTEVECKRTYSWALKYRPRKPQYLNRIITGFEWSKYNQKHYDIENPPPRVVQGYKFNIFYPDLLHRSTAPTYKMEAKPGSPDTGILRFIAGAPYEDIAFEIVNREWEISHRRGHRCVFDRGVLQLHFSFRRYFYRK